MAAFNKNQRWNLLRFCLLEGDLDLRRVCLHIVLYKLDKAPPRIIINDA